MPHGTQWSYDELRNAERAAQIQADAMRQAYREMMQEQERYARRPEPERVAPPPKPSEPPMSPVRYEAYKIRCEAAARRRDYEERLAVLKVAAPGTIPWIRARYGRKVWDAKVREYQERFSCTKLEAEPLVARDYKEEEWVRKEYPYFERIWREAREKWEAENK